MGSIKRTRVRYGNPVDIPENEIGAALEENERARRYYEGIIEKARAAISAAHAEMQLLENDRKVLDLRRTVIELSATPRVASHPGTGDDDD